MNYQTRHRIKQFVATHRVLRKLYRAAYVLRWCNEFERVGFVESQLRGESVDARGKPVPWLTYPAIAFLQTRVPSGLTVLEYGSGNSTLWWSQHAARIIAIEHDAEFHARLLTRLPENAECLLVADTPDGVYERKAESFGCIFDVVVIDGMRRVECAQTSMKSLKPEGVIIFDNSDRKDVEPALTYLKQIGFRSIDFRGPSSLITWSNTTTIFYRDGNCLGI